MTGLKTKTNKEARKDYEHESHHNEGFASQTNNNV